MVTFVNRQAERQVIDDAFNALQNYNNESLLRASIIDFFGIEGIGKTAILKYIEEQCEQQQIRYVLIDASRSARHFSYELIRQIAERYNIRQYSPNESEDLFQQSLQATKALLMQGMVVVILDHVDATNEELLERITITLRELINDRNLFVALASKRDKLFDSERSISRKITSFQLKLLDRKSCEHYLDVIAPSLTLETKKHILNWTRGYPLAMEIMTSALTEHKLDPTLPGDQKVLVDLIVERVIHQKVFARLTPSEQNKYKEVLTILSVPRNFNLLIMQKLIKQFAPDELKKGGNLAYMNLPGGITNDTGVLSWNIFEGGYVVDAPVRNIFLLKVRIEQTERYAALHQFLAELNKQLAQEVPGIDRIQYLCECLYHSAYVKSEQEFIQLLDQIQQEIAAISFESLEEFEAFEAAFEKLLQDNEGEFLDVLGKGAEEVKSLIYQYLAEINKRKVRVTSGEEHFYHLREYFTYIVKDPKVTDMRSVWTLAIQNVIAGKSATYRSNFVKELHTSENLRKALGSRFELFAELVAEIH